MTFADKLKKFMNDTGLTQADMCRNVGINKPTMSNWVNGRAEPSKERKRSLARDLGIEENYFDIFMPEVVINHDESVNLLPVQAARLLKKSNEFVKESLIQGTCPFGWAVKNKNWNFCIPKPAFRNFTKIKDDSNINVPVELAAKLIGKSDDFLRESMKQKVCPFGWGAEVNKWDFCIPIGAFEAYTKIKVPVNMC